MIEILLGGSLGAWAAGHVVGLVGNLAWTSFRNWVKTSRKSESDELLSWLDEINPDLAKKARDRKSE